jgi:hypothetical protein
MKICKVNDLDQIFIIYASSKRVHPSLIHSKTVSSNVLYIHPLYLSYIVSSKRFHSLYLISLQQRPLNHVLYTQIPILKTFFNFIFCNTYLPYSQMHCTYFSFAKPVI